MLQVMHSHNLFTHLDIIGYKISMRICCIKKFKASFGMLMHWNHSERCRLMALSIPQAQEVVQENEGSNFAVSMTSSNNFFENMPDNIEFDDNECDNNLCQHFTNDLSDGNDAKDNEDRVSNHYDENSDNDLDIMMKYLTFKYNNKGIVATQILNRELMLT